MGGMDQSSSKCKEEMMPTRNEYIEITKTQMEEWMKGWLGRDPKPVQKLTVPKFYQNWQGNRDATYNISMDAYAALDLAIISELLNDPFSFQAATGTVKFLRAWATENQGAGNAEGSLYLVTKGNMFIEAFELVRNVMNAYDLENFLQWVKHYYLPECEKLKARWLYPNNQNCEGWLGFIHGKIALGEDIGPYLKSFTDFVNTQIDGNTGKLKKEILRTNSGPWYCYAALVAMFRTALLLHREFQISPLAEVMKGIEWYCRYVKDPDSWPWILPGTGSNNPFAKVIGWIWKLFFPCSEELQKATPTAWPADLFETLLALEFDPKCMSLEEINNWLETGQGRPLITGNVFRLSTAVWCRPDGINIYLD